MSIRHIYSGTAWAPQTAASNLHVFTAGQWTPVVTPVIPDVPVTAFDALPNMTAFLDAADPAATGTAPANGATMLAWTDKKTASVYTPPTNSNAPTYRAATATEPAFVRFNGANQWMTRAGTFLPSTGAFTMYAVIRTGGLGYGAVLTQGSTTAVNPVMGIDLPPSGHIRGIRRTDDGALVQSQIPQIPNVWRVVSVTSEDWKAVACHSNEQAAAPGSSVATSTGVASCDTSVIGGRMSYSAAGKVDVPFLGDIACLVAYTGVHDANTRTKVTQQLATRCKIVLPSQGGTVDGPAARITTARQEASVEYGIPATHAVTGKTLPGFHNTGPDIGTVFQVVNGALYSTSNNQVIENKWIFGTFVPKHTGVTLRNCILYSTGDPKVDTRQLPTDAVVTIDKCEIYGTLNDGGTGLGYVRYTLTNSYVHDSEDEARLNRLVTIRGNLMCRQSNGFLTATERLHTDCVQSNGGPNLAGEISYIEDNTLIGIRRNLTKGNAAIILATEGASATDANGNIYNVGSPLRRVRVNGNYLANGSYTLYVKTPGQGGSPGAMEDITFTNNVIRGDALHGDMAVPHASVAPSFLTMSGNVREDGQPLNIFRWASPTQEPVEAVVGSFDAAGRFATVTWKQPATGNVTVTRTDSTGATATATTQALKGSFTFFTPVAAAATSVTVTVANQAGNSASATITVPAGAAVSPLLPRLTKTAQGMIQRSGVNWRTAGTNAFQLIHNDYPNPRLMTKPEIDTLLDKMVFIGAKLLRVHTMGANVGSGAGHLVTGVSGTGSNPTISYNSAVWDIMDYAVAACAARGIYLMVPMVDELGYYHGGKRHWVNFRRPGTVSLDYNVKASNSSTQRTAENYFYTDTQIVSDFKKYLSDWLTHVNPYTGRAYKDEPAIGIVETGNELWTAAQDAPAWTPDIAAHIKSIAPNVLVADGSAADGSEVSTHAWASANVDILGTHPYSTFGASDIARLAAFAASKGKAFLLGEYPWTKTASAAIEQAGLSVGNNVATLLWSLQNDADLHNGGPGSGYGGDDASFYVPGADATGQAGVGRVTALAADMAASAATATPPVAASTDSFTGTDGAAPNPLNWTVFTQTASTATIQGNKLRMRAAAAGGYGDKVTLVHNGATRTNGGVRFILTPVDATKEAYFSVALRAQTADNSITDANAYRLEINNSGNASVARRLTGASTAVGTGAAIPGWGTGVPVTIEYSITGTTVSVWAWTTGNKPATPLITGTNSALSAAGVTGLVLNGGNTATTVDYLVDDWQLV